MLPCLPGRIVHERGLRDDLTGIRGRIVTTATSTFLIETDWLQEHLHDTDLHVIDCTVFLPNYVDESAGTKVEIQTGRGEYESGHIPGSAFVDVIEELGDPGNTRFMFPMPSADQFARVMSRIGVGPGTRVVLYDRMVNIWAARVWWML